MPCNAPSRRCGAGRHGSRAAHTKRRDAELASSKRQATGRGQIVARASSAPKIDHDGAEAFTAQRLLGSPQRFFGIRRANQDQTRRIGPHVAQTGCGQAACLFIKKIRAYDQDRVGLGRVDGKGEGETQSRRAVSLALGIDLVQRAECEPTTQCLVHRGGARLEPPFWRHRQ